MLVALAAALVRGAAPLAIAPAPRRHRHAARLDPAARTGLSEALGRRAQSALTPLQYEVTQHEGTERAFSNKYWDNKQPGIYVDIVSGEPLFSSLEKFDSGTGWPSFWQPLEPANVKTERGLVGLSDRTRRCARSTPTRTSDTSSTTARSRPALRYCMNSAAMRFIPAEDLEKEGYGQYKMLFEKRRSKRKRVKR